MRPRAWSSTAIACIARGAGAEPEAPATPSHLPTDGRKTHVSSITSSPSKPPKAKSASSPIHQTDTTACPARGVGVSTADGDALLLSASIEG